MVVYSIPHFDPEAIAKSGQCFRMRQTGPGRAEVIFRDEWTAVHALPGGGFAFSCTEAAFASVWRPYFDLDTDYGAFLGAVDAGDLYLARAARLGQGLRILRQDPWEVLAGFILSQRKSIAAIRDGMEKLCRRFGEPLSRYGPGVYAFPTPRALAEASMEELAACSLGYRAPYIKAAARSVCSGETDLAALAALEDEPLFEKLVSLHGVGVKVANCVMLFGYHRLARAPVDVWIQRVIEEEYGGVSPFSKYKGFAGVMQQYMFYERIMGKQVRKKPAKTA